jgi:hypothetical protein
VIVAMVVLVIVLVSDDRAVKRVIGDRHIPAPKLFFQLFEIDIVEYLHNRLLRKADSNRRRPQLPVFASRLRGHTADYVPHLPQPDGTAAQLDAPLR